MITNCRLRGFSSSTFVHVLKAVFYTASLDEISAAKLIFYSRLVSSSQLNRSDKFQKKVPFFSFCCQKMLQMLQCYMNCANCHG